jgi:UDP-N-acetylmuramoyl-L-alanyl-D-glutamate--2,6-diaminopimelate ligase
MKLTELLAGVGTEPVASTKSKVDVTGITTDSRAVKPGDLFIAVPGTKVDGVQFVHDAIDKGAVAVLAEKPIGGVQTPVFHHARAARKARGPGGRQFLRQPARREVSLLGVTGTNGKTTTAWLVESIMTPRACSVTGLFGTIERALRRPDKRVATHTTPDPISAAPDLARDGRTRACDTVVMEVSSHALAQERVHGLSFRAAGFTNLSRDHLDFHKDMEAYFQAKRRLFTENLSAGGRGGGERRRHLHHARLQRAATAQKRHGVEVLAPGQRRSSPAANGRADQRRPEGRR